MHKWKQLRSHVGLYYNEELTASYMTVLGDFICTKCGLYIKDTPKNELTKVKTPCE